MTLHVVITRAVAFFGVACSVAEQPSSEAPVLDLDAVRACSRELLLETEHGRARHSRFPCLESAACLRDEVLRERGVSPREPACLPLGCDRANSAFASLTGEDPETLLRALRSYRDGTSPAVCFGDPSALTPSVSGVSRSRFLLHLGEPTSCHPKEPGRRCGDLPVWDYGFRRDGPDASQLHLLVRFAADGRCSWVEWARLNHGADSE